MRLTVHRTLFVALAVCAVVALVAFLLLRDGSRGVPAIVPGGVAGPADDEPLDRPQREPDGPQTAKPAPQAEQPTGPAATQDPNPAADNPLPGARVSARVRILVLVNDTPAIGAVVRLRALAHSDRDEQDWRVAPVWRDAGRATTDGVGEATIEVELATDTDGRRMVQAMASQEGFATGYSSEVQVTRFDASPLLTVELLPASSVSGRVTDESAVPIAAARVLIFSLRGSQFRAIATLSTGDDGRFRFEGLPTTRLMYEVRADGFAMRGAWQHQFTPAPGEHDLGDIALAPTGAVVGRLVDPQGQPVAGGAAFLRSLPTDWSREQPTHSGLDGRFAFETVYRGPGRYLLLIRAVGFRVATIEEVTVVAGETTDVGDIRLEPGETLSLKVVDAPGAPVAGAQVQMIPDGEHFNVGYQWQLDNHRAITDADGAARVVGLSPGAWILTVTADGFARYRETLNIDSGVDLSVTLQSGGGVTGRIEDARGVPAADALVGLIPHTHWMYQEHKDGTFLLKGSNWPRLTPRPALRTNAAGEFHVEDLAAGDYLLLAHDAPRKMLLLHDNVRVQTGAVTDVGSLAFAGLGSLLVELSNEAGPMQGTEVLLLGPGYRNYLEADGAGQVVFRDLEPGEYLIHFDQERFEREGLRPPARVVRVEADKQARASFSLPEQGCTRVWGRMTVNGSAAFFNISLFGHGVSYQAHPDDDGHYSFPSVKPGEYSVHLYSEGRRYTLSLTLSGEPSLEFSRDFKAVGVSGRVLSGASPVAGVEVFLQELGANASVRSQDSVKSGPDGTFEFAAVVDGRWRVGVAAPEGAAHADITVDGAAVRDVELKLTQAGSVAVIIRKMVGDAGVSGHIARLRDAAGDLLIAAEGFFPTDGARAVLEGVPPGGYTLELIGYGYCCRFIKDVNVKAGERTDIEIDLPAAAIAEIELSGDGLSAAGVAAAAVEWQDAQGSPIRLPWPYGVTSHKSGNTLIVPDLIPEVTRIVVSVPGFEPINVPFTFSAGERSKLQAALTRLP